MSKTTSSIRRVLSKMIDDKIESEKKITTNKVLLHKVGSTKIAENVGQVSY